MRPFKDALVRFAEDGSVFIRYKGILMNWPEFVAECEADGLPESFARDYANSLPLETH